MFLEFSGGGFVSVCGEILGVPSIELITLACGDISGFPFSHEAITLSVIMDIGTDWILKTDC